MGHVIVDTLLHEVLYEMNIIDIVWRDVINVNLTLRLPLYLLQFRVNSITLVVLLKTHQDHNLLAVRIDPEQEAPRLWVHQRGVVENEQSDEMVTTLWGFSSLFFVLLRLFG